MAELFQSEKYFRAIIEASIDGIVVVDEKGRIEFGNDSFYKIVNWPRDELLGQSFGKMLPDYTKELYLKIWQEILNNTNTEKSAVGKIVGKNGRIIYLHNSRVALVINGEKKILFNVKDITEQKTLELNLKESEAKVRELFENADDPMYTHDLEGYFLSINKVGAKTLGATEEEIIGSNVSQWLTPQSYNTFRERVKKIYAGEKLEEPVVIEVVCKNGEHKWGEVRTRLFRDGGGKIIVHGIARDITENIMLKKELNRSNKQRALLCYLIEGTRGGKTRALILKHLIDRSYNAHQLAKALDMDYKTIRHHLEVLIKNGIITKGTDSYTDLYFISNNVIKNLYSFDDNPLG